MDGITIEARNALEHEISFTPEKSEEFLNNTVAFLKDKSNFRFTSNGIKRELKRLGKEGDDEALLQEFKNLMTEHGLLSVRGISEGTWFRDEARPSKDNAIRMCFAFGLSSKTPTTALEFLWNVCRINGFNYRVVDDVVYYYALERGLSYSDADEIIGEYEAKVKEANIVFNDEDETKSTSVMWDIFEDMPELERADFVELLAENQKNFIGYNKTSRNAFIEVYNDLERLIADDIKDGNMGVEAAGFKPYSTGNIRDANVHAEVIYDGVLRALLGDVNFSNITVPTLEKGSALEQIMNHFPTQANMDAIKSNAKKNRKKATEFEQGFARKTFILCFLARYVLKYMRKSGSKSSKSFYNDFYYSLETQLHKCSYGLLYPANPFDWLVLKSVKAIDTANLSETDALELFNEILALLIQEAENADEDAIQQQT